jgi:hypothetical protein
VEAEYDVEGQPDDIARHLSGGAQGPQQPEAVLHAFDAYGLATLPRTGGWAGSIDGGPGDSEGHHCGGRDGQDRALHEVTPFL